MNETTDWRNLPAGRELDRLIAARAGQTVLTATEMWKAGWRLGDDESGEFFMINNGVADAIPAYSTSVDAALMLPGFDEDRVVVELYRYTEPITNLSRDEYFIWSHLLENPLHNIWYMAEIYMPDTDKDGDWCRDTLGIAFAPTRAWAICRAWLTWMETKGE